jgi:NADP-dependent 3-hydroxy acid dehydrogenase YdfG
LILFFQGSGVGRQAAISFAKAGAARIVLLGRREEKLKETASLVASASGATEAVVHAVDTTEFATLKAVASKVGKWNVLVIASVHASAISTLASTDVDEWWQGFEVRL